MKPSSPTDQSYRVGPYIVDGRARVVFASGIPVLSGVAFEIFYQMVRRRGEVVRRSEFLAWRQEEVGPDIRHPVDMHIVEIRRRLCPEAILSVPGKGYQLAPSFSVELIASPS
ncbi:MAG: winged helix-turn-helix domain-containing protein [Limisphaerales bacterium]